MSNADIKGYAERLSKLEDQRDEIASDIADLKKEADGQGIDKKALADTVRIMRMDADKRKKRLAQLDLFDTYLGAVGLR